MMTRNTIFISYSHKDRRWIERLQVHLTPRVKYSPIDIWDDRRIKAGRIWRDEINRALSAAKVAVLFLSADYFYSEFIATDELPNILAAQAADNLRVLPIIVGPCLFEAHPTLSRFQAINDPKAPVLGMRRDKCEAFFHKAADAICDSLHSEREVANHRSNNAVQDSGILPSFKLSASLTLVTPIADHNEELMVRVFKQGDTNTTFYPIHYLTHETPRDAPFIFASIEGHGLSVFADDIDKDGRPELFVEYVVGAHTHVLQVYKLPAYGGRPFQMEGGIIGADRSIILISDYDGDAIPEIYAGQYLYPPRFYDGDREEVWDVYKFVDDKIVLVREMAQLDFEPLNNFSPMYSVPTL